MQKCGTIINVKKVILPRLPEQQQEPVLPVTPEEPSTDISIPTEQTNTNTSIPDEQKKIEVVNTGDNLSIVRSTEKAILLFALVGLLSIVLKSKKIENIKIKEDMVISNNLLFCMGVIK